MCAIIIAFFFSWIVLLCGIMPETVSEAAAMPRFHYHLLS
jgi:hypothetical protein